jgi:hypothetical protein
MRCKAAGATQCEHCERRATPQRARYGRQKTQLFMNGYLCFCYYLPEVLDDTGHHETVANIQEREGNSKNAADGLKEILDSRLRMHEWKLYAALGCRNKALPQAPSR